MANDNGAMNAAAVGASPCSLTCESNAGVNTSNKMTYTIAAPPKGYKIVLRKLSGPASTGGSSGVVTFKSDVNNDGTQEVIGRLAAAVTSNAAFEIPLVASAQPASDALPLAVGGNGKSLVIVWDDTSITALLLEIMYNIVADWSQPINA